MICLVIGAGEESVYAINTAKQMGHYVIAFDGDDKATGLKYADESYVTDIRNENNIYEKLGSRIPDMVLPTPIGRILVTSGKVNDYYGLRGIGKSAADLCTDKYEFHRRMADIGMRNVQCIIFKNIGQAREVRNYPMILKPRFGAGSRDIFMINGEAQLEEAAKSLGSALMEEDFILESLVGGEEYGVDGARIDGSTQIILLRKKLLTEPPERQCVGYISVCRDEMKDEEWEKLGTLIDSAARALGIENSVFHADILRNADGFFMIEMSARPSGHNLHNLFTPMATGVEVIREYIHYYEKKPYSLIPESISKMMITYFDFEDKIIKSVPNEDYIREKYPIREWKCLIKAGDMLGKVPNGHSLMCRGFFIIEAENDEKLISLKKAVLEEFTYE